MIAPVIQHSESLVSILHDLFLMHDIFLTERGPFAATDPGFWSWDPYATIKKTGQAALTPKLKI